MPSELLAAFAQIAVAFAGLSALALVVVQLAGVRWQAQMTTGFWLLITWSLGAIVFSLLPLLLLEFGISESAVVSICSACLGMFVFVVIGSALRRDTRILRLQIGAKPPVRTMMLVGGLAALSAFAMLLNAFFVLPGPRAAWYLAGVFEMLLFAIVPLAHLLVEVSEKD
ncbi:MAG: hypothetical protein ABIO38_09045 [Luteimonas sp.]